jgi:hypothetical protein
MKKQKELVRMLSVVNELNANLTAQLADKDAEAAHWKANHDNMVKKNALLSQRHDLPVDRIQAAKHFDDLSAEVERLRELLRKYLHPSELQTFESRERFREAAMKLLSTTQQEGE